MAQCQGLAGPASGRLLPDARGSLALKHSSFRPSTSRASPPAHTHSRRRRLSVQAVGWDPENILAAPQPGHIARRTMQKQMNMEDQEAQREAQRKIQQRMMREVPEGDEALLEYLMRIGKEEGAEELKFEVARCGLRLTDSFFAVLRSAMGTIRFAVRQSQEDTERLAALEKLEKQLQEQVEKQETLRKSIVDAKDRLHGLLSAPDKKEKILAMAAAGELDMGLLSLLDENIAAAQAAEQASAVQFMEKIRGAVVRFMSKEQLTQ